jgi:hypothetical protein
MRLREFAEYNGSTPEPAQLMGLVSFLNGRANDTAGKKQIDQNAFIELARNLGIILTKNSLPELVGQPPLSNILEPLAPDSNDPIVFKGAETPAAIKMPVNKAQNIVAAAAKSAAKRKRGV